jgi:hypothetical protein
MFTKDGEEFVVISSYKTYQATPTPDTDNEQVISIYKFDNHAGVLNFVCSVDSPRKLVAAVPGGAGFYNGGSVGYKNEYSQTIIGEGLAYYSFDGSSITLEAEIGTEDDPFVYSGTNYYVNVLRMFFDTVTDSIIAVIEKQKFNLDIDATNDICAFSYDGSSVNRSDTFLGFSSEGYGYNAFARSTVSPYYPIYLACDNADGPLWFFLYDGVTEWHTGLDYLWYANTDSTGTYSGDDDKKFINLIKGSTSDEVWLGDKGGSIVTNYNAYAYLNSYIEYRPAEVWSSQYRMVFSDPAYYTYPGTIDGDALVSNQYHRQTVEISVLDDKYYFTYVGVEAADSGIPTVRCYEKSSGASFSFVGADSTAGVGDLYSNGFGGVIYYADWLFVLLEEGVAIYNLDEFYRDMGLHRSIEINLTWIPSIQ